MFGALQWLLDVTVIALLAATLFHALRLQRALGVLSRDRPALEALVTNFNLSTQQAENGIERLRSAAEGAGRTIARQNDAALALKDDLGFLIERGDRLANRLDMALRAGPPPHAPQATPGQPSEAASPERMMPSPNQTPTRVRSQAERDLLTALRTVR